MFSLASDTLDILMQLVDDGPVVAGPMAAAQVPGRSNDLLALDSDGSVMLLVRQWDTDGDSAAGWEHRAFTVLPRHEYDVTVGGQTRRDVYRAVVLKPGHSHLLTGFGYMVSALLSSLDAFPTSRQVDAFIGEFIQLFSVDRGVSPSRVIGLWGELWVIQEDGQVESWLGGWHLDSSAPFDFTFDGVNVEVKTSVHERSEHRFSHTQIVSDPQNTYVVSVLIQEDRGGLSITELVDRIGASLNPALRGEFYAKILRFFGKEIEMAHEFKYRVRPDQNPMFVRADYLPRVYFDAGDPLFRISYDIDLTASLADHGRPLADLGAA